MPKFPLSPAKVWDVYKDITRAAEVPAGLVLAGDTALIARAQAELARNDGPSRVWTGPPAELRRASLGEGEVLVLFVQPRDEDQVVEHLREAKLAGGGVVVVDDGPAAGGEATWYQPGLYRVSFADRDDGWQALMEAALDLAPDNLVPLARRYPVLRRPAAQRMIRRTSRQNAVVGAAFFIPGTDMPVMTLNQIKMVMGIAAMYGQDMTRERALELLSVVGAGFAFRTVARQVVDLVPGAGWAVKSGMGYTATRAMGEAALRYFEDGAPATPSRLVALARRIRS